MLTVSGIFGVLSFLVSQTREIGIRVALGAQSGSIVGMVMRQSMRLAGIGIVLGVVLAMAAAAVAASDPATRAAKVEPVTSLRCD